MVDLPSGDVDWFHEVYGGSSLSWLLSSLLSEFRKSHTMGPKDYSEIAARELKRRIEENLE